MKKTTIAVLLLAVATILFVSRNTILSHGAAGGQGALVKLALLVGADPNGGDADVPPLVAAARNGDATIVERLVDAKANVDAKEKESGRTALMFAAESGNADIVDVLLRAKPKLDIVDKSDKSAYSYAFANNHFDVAHKVRPERPQVVVDLPSSQPAVDPNSASANMNDEQRAAIKKFQEEHSQPPQVPSVKH